jgi:hypothetical protein
MSAPVNYARARARAFLERVTLQALARGGPAAMHTLTSWRSC